MTQAGFLVFYLIALIPTYILPYFGSNSLIAAFATFGLTAVFSALHAACFVVMIWAAFMRGPIIGRQFLWALPMGALFFDLVPGLNWIPLVPTVLHLVALFIGTMTKDLDDPTSK
jgi:hypothetical protein